MRQLEDITTIQKPSSKNPFAGVAMVFMKVWG